jgi:UDP-3-O-[3-hydroxymyristoyl] glucosamine N-acyltransferase
MVLTVAEIARHCGLEIVAGDGSAEIDGAANIDEAGPRQLSFIARVSAADKLAGAAAGAVIVPRALSIPSARAGMCVLAADDPEIAFIGCLNLLYPAPVHGAGVSAGAHVDPSAAVGEGSFVAAGATLGKRVKVGRHCAILAGCYLGADVEIGDHCTLHPNVVLYHGTVVRDHVVIHAGSVIGTDGYGYKQRQGVHVKFPQVGRVLIERDVEIGANACIDRAALGLTVIGAGTKIDNQVHIAHNVKVGKGVLILGQTGIGGSTVIEDYAILASQ